MDTAQPISSFSPEQDLKSSSMLQLADHFHRLATGATQVPAQSLTSHIRHSIADADVVAYHDRLVEDAGPLFLHFLASVPYILEEMARVGVALSRLSQARQATEPRTFGFFEIDAFDGSNGRALAAHSQGLISTFTTSPNQANQPHFDRHADPARSLFYPQSFLTLHPRLFAEEPYERFNEGFDYVYETAAFQFYTRDRKAQINHIKPLLKPGALVFFLEKLNHEDLGQYLERERVKDSGFKTRYFSEEEIDWKRQQMLEQMQNGQVLMHELVDALSSHFKYVYLLWNSTNFYEFVATDDGPRLEQFLSLLGPINQPEGFCFEARAIGYVSRPQPCEEERANG
ncbi:class I SAM-dependent methyltransferase [Pseudomonas uvaldensis]|uniref:class I SAM-dependent methyltransferase n=1 Tax=Pseudomonas uvaldensis TaxID=2878385 RepID=UPI001E3A81B5|nr:class I SAM-dependent methyltransferase [Pseudomonas uvaldensis]MCE0459885.1 class I SAM-dependent methyltransferase [Pseudomonas uvaldensis]